MGLIRLGPPEDLVLELRDELGAHTFVETGTYVGATAAWAAGLFDQVVTIEASPAIHATAAAALAHLENLELLLGDSETVLPRVVARLDGPAVFWLDAHWSGYETYRGGRECPLLEELRLVLSCEDDHAILIDDARLFASAPPLPHDPAAWPTLDEIVEIVLERRPRPAFAITEDVIAIVPSSLRQVLVAYCQDVSTRAWESFQSPPANRLLRLAARVRAAVSSR